MSDRQPSRLLLPAILLAPLLLSLGGCIGLDVAAFHRSTADLVYSAISGRDCSIVRLDQGESYCKPVAPPVPPQPFCTRSLAMVDCWTEPALLADRPRGVGDGPSALTAEQDRVRLARWPTDLQ